jgi:hypothetical protein
MDTIKQAANAVSGAIWGESNTSNAESYQSGNEQSGTEPLSGRTGDVSKGEPYDAGNSGGTSRIHRCRLDVS